jgi:glyceraldehyde 3-phosphate dehydrogenase
MPVRVGINGFGRIGRNVFCAGMAANADVEWVAVNDITDNATLAHLLRYDTAYGRFPGTVESNDDGLVVDGKPVKVLAERDRARLPWSDLGVALVI